MSFFSDVSMLELFKSEAVTHSATLETGLVALEAGPKTPDRIEPLMRAAHSIKGAARIVGLARAVELAHAMEDLLVAAQHGKHELNADSVDVLLQGVDVFKRLSEAKPEGLSDWLQANESSIQTLVSSLADLQSGKTGGPVPKPAPAQSEPAAKSVSEPQKQVERSDDGTVQVTAENLSRLMGLAGECVVAARQLHDFSSSLRVLKAGEARLSRAIEELQAATKRADLVIDDEVGAALEELTQCREQLARHIEGFDLFTMRWENLSNRLYNEAVATRMRPFRDGIGWSHRMVRDLARKLNKKIRFAVSGESSLVDRDILAALEAPLTHLLQNACDHGIESPDARVAAGKNAEGSISLMAGHRAGMFHITISDDGKGIDQKALRKKIVDLGKANAEMAERMTETELFEFLFLPGFSTAGKLTEISGRGVGLDVVASMLQKVSGSVRVQSEFGRGTVFTLQAPLTLSVVRTLLVEIGGEPYAFPLMRVDRVLVVPRNAIESVEGRQYVRVDGANIGILPASQPLGLDPRPIEGDRLCIVVVSDRINQYGVVVERLVGERNLVVRPLDARLGRVADIGSAAIMDDGAPVLIIDVEDLVRSMDNMLSGGRAPRLELARQQAEAARQKRVLVVDDSITVREAERQILEKSGYVVDTAVDGMDGWNAIRVGGYDLVVSDVDMPRMNGIEMVKQLRKEAAFKSLPVVIVSYKDREEDRIRGLEAGANIYLTKSSFYDESFLSAVVDLIGEA